MRAEVKFPLWASVCALPYAILAVAWPTFRLLLPDDAYYYLKIAGNLAGGLGSTFDGINSTNGYHPLWLLILAALPKPAPEKFVSMVLVIQCALAVLAFSLAFQAIRLQLGAAGFPAAAVASFLLLSNYYASKTMINGLESALCAVLSALLLLLFGRAYSRGPVGRFQAVLLGVLASCVVMARLDSVFLVLAIVLTWAGLRSEPLRRTLSNLGLFLFPVLATLAVYMAANQLVFGLWMPVSGYLKRSAFSFPSLSAIVGFMATAGLLLLGLRLTLRRLGPRTAAGLVVTATTLFLLLYHADSMLVRGVIVPEIWYLSLDVLWGFMVLTVLLEQALTHPRRGAVAIPATATAIVLVAASAVSWSMRLNPRSYDHYLAAREAARWMQDRLPREAVAAGWDVGIVGYYSRRRVVNLDGLVNSAGYVKALRGGDVLSFLDESGVDYIVQYWRHGFEHANPPGMDPRVFRERASELVWSRPVTFLGFQDLALGRFRRLERYRYEIREYRR